MAGSRRGGESCGMKFACIAIALLAGACTARAPVESLAMPVAQTSACGVTVTFGSYAMGIDRASFAAVEALLAGDQGVTTTSQKRWGREGEVTVCVETGSAADSARLFGEIARLFPEKPRGPLTVETVDGRKFETGATP
jgi:hypothetical protein